MENSDHVSLARGAADGQEDGELPSSKLGTKSHWDSAYEVELKNFADNRDEGEVWFGEDSLVRVLRWMEKAEVAPGAKILDLGCGNGVSCVEMVAEGFTNVFGVDYSEAAIELARKVAAARELESSVDYQVCDLLNSKDAFLGQHEGTFDVLFDKGTYDAVSLNPEDAFSARKRYIRHCHRLLKPQGGLLILTSCNWTLEELQAHFSCEADGDDASLFVVRATIPTPSFQFGGKVGNQVTSVVFVKNK